MNGNTPYTNEAQQRLLRLITALAGHEITGMAPAEIARELDCSAPMVTRDMANLQQGGWAEQVPETGRWRLSTHPVQLWMRHTAALDKAQSRLNEIKARFSRS